MTICRSPPIPLQVSSAVSFLTHDFRSSTFASICSGNRWKAIEQARREQMDRFMGGMEWQSKSGGKTEENSMCSSHIYSNLSPDLVGGNICGGIWFSLREIEQKWERLHLRFLLVCTGANWETLKIGKSAPRNRSANNHSVLYPEGF